MINTDFRYPTPHYIDLTLDAIFKQCSTYKGARSFLLSNQANIQSPTHKKQLLHFLTINDTEGALFILQALQNNDCQFIQKIIDLGYSVDQTIENKSPLIFYACSLEMFELLLANGASIDSKSGNETVFSAYIKWMKFQKKEEFEKIVVKIIELKKQAIFDAGLTEAEIVCYSVHSEKTLRALIENDCFFKGKIPKNCFRLKGKRASLILLEYLNHHEHRQKIFTSNERYETFLKYHLINLDPSHIDNSVKIVSGICQFWQKNQAFEEISKTFSDSFVAACMWLSMSTKDNDLQIRILKLLQLYIGKHTIKEDEKFAVGNHFRQAFGSTNMLKFIRGTDQPNDELVRLEFLLELGFNPFYILSCSPDVTDAAAFIARIMQYPQADNQITEQGSSYLQMWHDSYVNQYHENVGGGNLHYVRFYLNRGFHYTIPHPIAGDTIIDSFPEMVARLLLMGSYSNRCHIIKQLSSSEFNSVIEELLYNRKNLIRVLPDLLLRFAPPRQDRLVNPDPIHFKCTSPYEEAPLNLLNLAFGDDLSPDLKEPQRRFELAKLAITKEPKIQNFLDNLQLKGLEELQTTMCIDKRKQARETYLEDLSQSLIKNITTKTLSWDDFSSLIESLPSEKVLVTLRQLFDNPEQMKAVSKRYIRILDDIFICQGRPLQTTFAAFALTFLSKMTANHTRKVNQDLLNSHHQYVIPTPVTKIAVKGTLDRKIGRTYVMRSKPTSKRFHAYKIMKIGESLSQFSGEGPVTAAYKASRLFESTFHKPKGIYFVDHLPEAFKADDTRSAFVIYHYKASPEYFTYLYELEKVSDAIANSSRLIAVKDYTTQIRQLTVFTETGHFHNKEANRSYLTIPDIAQQRRLPNSSQAAGRLDAPFKADSSVVHSDTRVGTIADLNDVVTLEQALKDPQFFISSDFASNQNEEEQRLILQMNALSRMWLNDVLLLVLRLIKQKAMNWKDDDLCGHVGENLRKTYVTSLQQYTGETLEKCEIFSLNANIHWKRMARQLMFWTDVDKGYPLWIAEESELLPKTLYGKNTEARCQAHSFENLRINRIFSNNGTDIDIGGFNGPLGLVELEKAWMIFGLWSLALAEEKV